MKWMRRSDSAHRSAPVQDPAMAGAFWDLRDHAHDHPDEWDGVTAEVVFQAVAAVIERAAESGTAIDWSAIPSLVAAGVLGRNDPAPLSTTDPNEAVQGQRITGINFVHDFIEVHMDDVILTGYTQPFGIIGCAGVGPSSIPRLVGKVVEELSVVEGEYVAIDSGENRLAFPIGGPSVKGPESVRLYRPAHHELGIPSAHWIW